MTNWSICTKKTYDIYIKQINITKGIAKIIVVLYNYNKFGRDKFFIKQEKIKKEK